MSDSRNPAHKHLSPQTKNVKVKGAIDDHCVSLTPQKIGIQHRVFAESHPYSYHSCLTRLNFREQRGTMLSGKENTTEINSNAFLTPPCACLKMFATTPKLNRLERFLKEISRTKDLLVYSCVVFKPKIS